MRNVRHKEKKLGAGWRRWRRVGMAKSWLWCLSLGVQGGLEKQGAERNELDQRKLAEKEKGEVWQLPKETEIWGRQRC